MLFHRSAMLVLALAASAIGCRRDRDVPATGKKAVEQGERRATNVETVAPSPPAGTVAPRPPAEPAEPRPPTAPAQPRPYAETNAEPPVAPAPPPNPAPPRPNPAPPPSPPVVIVQPASPAPSPPVVIVQQQPPAPSGPQPVPLVSSPYAPTTPGYLNDAGVVVPAVPLYIDPSAAPGAPGNGAPDPTTTGEP